MKLICQTDAHLILRSVPIGIGVMLSVGILISVAFGMNGLLQGDTKNAVWGLFVLPVFFALFLIVFVRRDEMILDRTEDLLELRHATLLGRKRIRHTLTHLDRAIVQSSRTSKGGTTHRVALVLTGGMDAGTHPITPVYAGGGAAQRNADTINAWLAQDVDRPAVQA